MTWEIKPQPTDPREREALVAAAEKALPDETAAPRRWWSSGFDDLGGGPAPEQAWRDAGVVEA